MKKKSNTCPPVFNFIIFLIPRPPHIFSTRLCYKESINYLKEIGNPMYYPDILELHKKPHLLSLNQMKPASEQEYLHHYFFQ